MLEFEHIPDSDTLDDLHEEPRLSFCLVLPEM